MERPKGIAGAREPVGGIGDGASRGTRDATIARGRSRGSMLQASSKSAGTNRTPTLRVSAATNPPAAAGPHRPRRAHQNVSKDASRNMDSL